MSKITKGTRVEFHNGHDVLRGTVVARYVDDPKPGQDPRPDLEETWTVFADSVLVRAPVVGPDGKPQRAAGAPLVKATAAGAIPLLSHTGAQKLGDGGPITADRWVKVINDDGVQTVRPPSSNGNGEPIELVKNGVPVPFRVRARRLQIVTD